MICSSYDVGPTNDRIRRSGFTNRVVKLAILPALASAAMAASALGLMSTGAAAINDVPCDNPEFVAATLHQTGQPGPYSNSCFANGGEEDLSSDPSVQWWVTNIWTGNNKVQWYGDGKWQPDQPIPPHTNYSWPNHPGGVSIERIRIV